MSNVSQLKPLQFKKMYPNGAYAYILVWGPDNIRPAKIMYPFRLFVDEGPNCIEQFYAEDLKTGTLKGLGYYPNYVYYASSDLEKVKDHFKLSVRKAVEGRIKWLQKQQEDIGGIAQCIVDKINKF